jgi:integrase
MAIKQVKVRGKKRWQARVAYRGERLSRLCESWDQAKQAEAELLQQLVGQADEDAQAEAAPVTLALLCEAYLLDLAARGKAPDSIIRAKDTGKRLQECFGARMQDPLGKFSEADLFAFRTWRVQHQAKPATINRDFRTISAMLKRADPTFRLPKGVFFREDETRVRWLEPLQELYMSRLRSPFREMAQLADLTLMRLTEVRTLRRSQVSLSQGVISLPTSKTGPDQVVLSQEARRILQAALDRGQGEYIFPAPHGGPYALRYVGTMWRRAARAAGLTDFHFHDLRHDGATKALNAGYTAPIVMALGRWKTERMMRRYAAVTDKTLRAAAEAVSGNLPPVNGNNGNGQWQRAANLAEIRS